MNRYDWGWDRSYDWTFRGRPRRYGFDPRRHAGWEGVPDGSWSWGRPRGGWERAHGGYRGGDDRGVYGNPYPTYGGYPGAEERGMYYGDRALPRRSHAYDRGVARPYARGYGEGSGRVSREAPAGWARGERYDRGMAREPFLPDSAYERHPELDRPPRHLSDRWPADASPGVGVERDDEEIRQSVRQNLFNDSWVKAERIEVEVAEQVVTLKGEVDDYLEARYAWDDAWDADGVRGVINQLTVRTDKPAPPEGDILPQTSGGKKGKK